MLMVVHGHIIFHTVLTQGIWIFLRPVLHLRSYSATTYPILPSPLSIRYVLSRKLQDHKELHPKLIKIRLFNHFRRRIPSPRVWNKDCITLALDGSSGCGFDLSLIRKRQSTHMFVGRITGSH